MATRDKVSGAEEVLGPVDSPDGHNLKSYEEGYQNFKWEQSHSQFDWHKTGKVNMAHEAIDRHVNQGKSDKLALVYSDNEGSSQYTFEELSRLSNRFANVLRKIGVKRGDRVFVFMSRRTRSTIISAVFRACLPLAP